MLVNAGVDFVSVCRVSKSYPVRGGLFTKSRMVLHDVSFGIKRGEICGLLGESGSGKSTLARIILGLEPPDSGSMLFDGRKKLRPGGMSVVFQNYIDSVNPSFTVGEIIAEGLIAGMGGIAKKSKHLESVIQALMVRTGLDPDMAGLLPHRLSGGQLQRVCIARALAQEPDFIVFDEAVSALDASTQAQILDLLKQVQGGTTYLFITHDIQAAIHLCDRFVLLQDGRVADTAERREKLFVSPHFKPFTDSTVLFESDFDGLA